MSYSTQTTVRLPRDFRGGRNPGSFPSLLLLGLLIGLARLSGRSQIGLALLLILVPATVHAQGLPATEKQKIEALINQVGALKTPRLSVMAATYQVATAVRFLRGKWDANAAAVKSAKDFIEKVASFSATSGKPYLIRFADGREIKSQEFLLAELKRIETGG